MARSPNGVVAWEGPSLFTGRPIRLLISCLNPLWPSVNEKTGPMLQTSILPAGVNPTKNFGTERERDTCGDCDLTGAGSARVCYAAMQAWLAGRSANTAPVVELAEAVRLIGQRPLRMGSYGDPAAIPTSIWGRLLAGASHWTGFTHAWRSCDQDLQQWLMASVNSREQQVEASEAGWRTFRIRQPGGDLGLREVVCPNEDRGVKCIDCALCQGLERPAANVVITVHGLGARRFREAA